MNAICPCLMFINPLIIFNNYIVFVYFVICTISINTLLNNLHLKLFGQYKQNMNKINYIAENILKNIMSVKNTNYEYCYNE
jgi:hypothetical protein